MAKRAKIFSHSSNGVSVGALYTVPANCYAICNIMPGLGNASNGVLINGQLQSLGGTVTQVNGLVLPAGATIQARTQTGEGTIVTGFEYDV